jgi:hypothetical protein
VRAGVVRFRPVILTAVTTALGLIPLAIGLNFNYFGLYARLKPELYWGGEQAAMWGPMAIAVIIGILFATFLTLILVPVLYSVMDDATDFFKRNYTHGGEVSVVQIGAGATSGRTWSLASGGVHEPNPADPPAVPQAFSGMPSEEAGGPDSGLGPRPE